MGTHRFTTSPPTLPPPTTTLTYVTHRDADGVRIAFAGEVDMGTAGTVQAAVLEALGTDSPRHLEVDLADVGFLGSAGINALVRCRAHTAAAGCRMAVTNPQPIVYEVLRITGVLQALAVTPLRRDRSSAPARPPWCPSEPPASGHRPTAVGRVGQ